MMANLGTAEADKSLIIFEESAHSPMVSETEKIVEVVVKFIDQHK